MGLLVENWEGAVGGFERCGSGFLLVCLSLSSLSSRGEKRAAERKETDGAGMD